MTENLEIRPWRSGDLALLRASEHLFERHSYPRRFLTGHRRLRSLHASVVQQIAEPARRWTGQVALDGDRLVALAECSWDPAEPQSPTLRINVAETWQGTGLDRRLLRNLVSRCLIIGLTTFAIDYAASNVTIDAMLQAIAAEAGEKYSVSAATRSGIGYLTVRAG
jgi:GNAT superfamily N-acetyltransferase